MGKSINYNSRTFEEFREQLKLFTQRYYPDTINDFQDASIGSYLIDLNAAVADDLSYHIDKKYQETQIDYAQERKSLLSIARTNGLKVPGKRPSIIEAKWSCFLPVDSSNGSYTPDWSYAPILSKGTQASGGGQKFELVEDVYFSEQFNKKGISDRTITPLNSTTGGLVGYTITKTCVMVSTEGKIFKQYISSSDVEPFMNIVLPDSNVVKVESILIVDGNNNVNPTISEFMSETPTTGTRWFEVENLTEDKLYNKDYALSNSFRDKVMTTINNSGFLTGSTNYGNTYCGKHVDGSVIYGYIPSVAKWKDVTKKFITEYTDNGFCRVIFGAGTNESELNANSINNAKDFNQYQLNKIINNKFLGELPKSNSTIYIYYSVGGGKQSNIAVNVMTTVTYLNATISGADNTKNVTVRNSIGVTNTTPSVSGRDELSNDEIRYLIKYNNSAQDRCVTLKDYENRIMTMPSEFGAPLKLGVAERNNKILISMLGLDYDGTLSENLSETLVNNIIEYLSEYKMVNDYVEIQPGKIVNLQFEVDITLENEGVKQDVLKNIILYVGDYMDVNNHKMGDEIYVSKMKSDIAAISGVKNLIDFRIYNIYSSGYSANQIKQPVLTENQELYRSQVDLVSSDGILYTDDDTIFEIKYPRKDIKITPKSKI